MSKNRPCAVAIKLYDLGTIHTISVKYRQTGTDTADTYVTIVGDHGKVEGLASTWMPYLDLSMGHNYVAELRDNMSRQVMAWKDYEKENEEELKEYKRLKKKFS